MLPQIVLESAFRNQYGRTLNFEEFGTAIKTLNKWYEDRGILGQVQNSLAQRYVQAATAYVSLASAERNGFTLCRIALQVVDVEMGGGVADLRLAEAVVTSVNLRYVDPKSAEVRDEGRTQPEVILRQLCTKPGQVDELFDKARNVYCAMEECSDTLCSV